MHIMLLIYSIVVLTVFLGPHTYFGELFISFLPYHGLILFFLVLVSCYSYKQRRYKIFWIISMIIGISTAWYTNYQRTSFYDNTNFNKQENYGETNEEVGLTFFFANVLKSNKDYEGIQATIEQLDPDVVLLSEYKQHHHDNLKDFFGQEYKYVNRIIGEQDIVGNVIFSKYPLEDFAPKIYQEARRYWYVAVTHEGKNYYFYHVHTSAPVSEAFWLNRKEQLSKFTNSFIEQDLQRLPEDRVVLVGDFNVTPWSPDFKKFNREISKTMVHFSKFTPLLTTRGFGIFNKKLEDLLQHAVRAHIDHLWINKQTTFYHIKVIEIPGSDHDGLYARIK